jgi:pyridoxal/pyridoxine/pyridoxamine kinase
MITPNQFEAELLTGMEAHNSPPAKHYVAAIV